TDSRLLILNKVHEHFDSAPLEEIALTERHFPCRVGADLQLALDQLENAKFDLSQFWVPQQDGCTVSQFQQIYIKNRRNPVRPGSAQYQEFDVGEDQPVRCLRGGLWLLVADGARLAVILDTSSAYEIRFQVAAPTGKKGTAATQRLFKHLED